MDKGSWQIGVLFAGAALGGTYLGGYEWLRFFAYFGSWGTIGIVLCSIGLGWFGYSALAACHRHGLRSLHDLCLHWFGEAIGPSLSALIHLFLLAYAGIMTGQQAIQWTGHSFVWLLVLTPFLVASLFLRHGWKLILPGTGYSLAAGFLVLTLIFVEQRHVPIPHLGYQMNLNWIVHAVFYLSMHFLLCLAMTIPLASRQAKVKTIRIGIWTGALFFLLITMLGQAILLAYWHDVHASLVPFKQILLQLLPIGDWVLALISLVHGGIMIAALIYSLSVPVAVRRDLHLTALNVTMLGTTVLFALIPLALPWTISLIASGATYCGLLLLIGFVWKRQM